MRPGSPLGNDASEIGRRHHEVTAAPRNFIAATYSYGVRQKMATSVKRPSARRHPNRSAEVSTWTCTRNSSAGMNAMAKLICPHHRANRATTPKTCPSSPKGPEANAAKGRMVTGRRVLARLWPKGFLGRELLFPLISGVRGVEGLKSPCQWRSRPCGFHPCSGRPCCPVPLPFRMHSPSQSSQCSRVLGPASGAM